jgi:hypothetical protein
MTTETSLKVHNITSKPALKYGSETWVWINETSND